MIYVISFVIGLYCLANGIPALRHILRMMEINRNCATTIGEARSVPRKLGTMLAWEFGESKQFAVYYLSPTKKELVIDVITSSNPHPSYESNQGVEVVYDKNSPGRAYTKPEWEKSKRELWITSIGLVVAIALWILGKALNLP
jgi:hypothetical protein